MSTTSIGTKTDLIPVNKIGDHIPWPRPGGPTRQTLWRWEHVGVNGVKLATVRIAGRVMVSLAELDRFVAAFNVKAPRLRPDLTLAAQVAARELEAMGA